MDYGTFFLTNFGTVFVFTVAIGLLAWYNRRVEGMQWFAAAQLVGLAKLILQGLEGRVPEYFSSLIANELYLVSFLLQWMGLRWFVVRRPGTSRWPWSLVGVLLAVYTCALPFRLPYSANLINIPFVVVCAASAWMLWTNAKGQFSEVARVCAAVAALQMAVAAYRAVLTDLRYIRPHETAYAHTDPCWVYSLAAAAFFADCMAMCEMWFLVTELQSELASQARTDPLTGALNRRSMEEAALRETARSLRYGSALSAIVLDIDNFKRLNDTMGHAAGDCALQALVRLLRSMLRQQDRLARMGGEEFAVLLPDATGEDALVIAERLRQAVAGLETGYEDRIIRMTLCAGVAAFDPAFDWEEMLRRADTAMYAAKRLGRNRVADWTEAEVLRVENPEAQGDNDTQLLPSGRTSFEGE